MLPLIVPQPPLKNSAFGILFSGLSVCEWVHESVHPWTPYLKSQWREFHPVFATCVIRLIDVLIRFWGQKVKGQGHSREQPKKPCEYNIW